MSTTELSPEKMHRSRNMQSDILQAVAETKQVNVAKCLGVESSTVGRWIDANDPKSQVVRFCDMLALCGLKIVPANTKHYDSAKIETLFRMTKDYFQRLDGVDDFFQGDAGMSDSHSMRFSRVGDLSDVNTNSNIVSELLASLYKTCKSLVAPNRDNSEGAVLIARQQIEEEIQQEIEDRASDEAAFWKMLYILIHVVLVLIVLSAIYRFWG